MRGESMQPEYTDNETLQENQEAEQYGLSEALIGEVSRTLDDEDGTRLSQLILELHPADQAELLKVLSPEHRDKLLVVMQPHFDAEILTHLDGDLRDDVLEKLGARESAAAISQLDTDDAVQVIEDLSEQEQQEILDAIPEEYRTDLQESLSFPDSSAGRLMRKEFVVIPEFWSVGNTIDYLRQTADNLPSDFYAIFVVDPRFRPQGTLLLSRIMQSKRSVNVRDIMNTDFKPFGTHMDQEEVAHVFRKYGLVEAPVVNGEGRMLGTITVDDVVNVIQEEGEEDLMKMSGLIEQDLHADLMQTVKKRFPWLFVNMATAFVASQVISQFQDTISHLVVLAVLMPIVASMGGNAGIQAVTVAVRAISTRSIKASNVWSVVKKELLIGALNGMAFAIINAAIAYIWIWDIQVAFIFGLATLGTLLIAGLAGVLIPLLLYKIKQDPAVSSGVFLTTMTDVTAFFTFLGLAALMLR